MHPVTQHFYITFSCSILEAELLWAYKKKKKLFFGNFLFASEAKSLEQQNRADREKQSPDLHQGADLRKERKEEK